jgi:viroplasmin and RNaseH domain-containing protein
MTTRWYIVFEGRVPGVYDKWEDCFKQVNKFKSNNYNDSRLERRRKLGIGNIGEGERGGVG